LVALTFFPVDGFRFVLIITELKDNRLNSHNCANFLLAFGYFNKYINTISFFY